MDTLWFEQDGTLMDLLLDRTVYEASDLVIPHGLLDPYT